MATPSMNMRDPYSAGVPGSRAQRCKYDTCGAEPMRAEPIGLAGRRLNRSAKVSPVASLVEAVECGLLQHPPPQWGISGGLPEQFPGQRGNGWGAHRHIGGWLVGSPGDFLRPPLTALASAPVV